jgi:hypothetical protein
LELAYHKKCNKDAGERGSRNTRDVRRGGKSKGKNDIAAREAIEAKAAREARERQERGKREGHGTSAREWSPERLIQV